MIKEKYLTIVLLFFVLGCTKEKETIALKENVQIQRKVAEFQGKRNPEEEYLEMNYPKDGYFYIARKFDVGLSSYYKNCGKYIEEDKLLTLLDGNDKCFKEKNSSFAIDYINAFKEVVKNDKVIIYKDFKEENALLIVLVKKLLKTSPLMSRDTKNGVAFFVSCKKELCVSYPFRHYSLQKDFRGGANCMHKMERPNKCKYIRQIFFDVLEKYEQMVSKIPDSEYYVWRKQTKKP
jgi:Sec7-like guanine-nucleotide exchange factor